MNVQPVKLYSNTFKGMFSEPSVSFINDTSYYPLLGTQVGRIRNREVRNYIPFKDDSAETIEKEVGKYTKSKTNKNGQVDYISESVVHIGNTFPATKKEVIDFIQRHNISKKSFLENIEIFKLVFKKR